MKILLTGAGGFLGGAVLSAAKQRNINVTPVFRSLKSKSIYTDPHYVIDFDKSTDWKLALDSVDVVVHLAGRVQTLAKGQDALSEYRSVNVDGTMNLARQAAKFGVKRFIFISSIKVNGEFTLKGQCFSPEDIPNPQDSYALSKSEAEFSLMELAAKAQIDVVIIRPPLIYGPGVKGYFSTLLNLINFRIPLPLGCVNENQRSFVALDNLVDLILICIDHPMASNQTFLVSDGKVISTKALVQKVGLAMGRFPLLFPVPLCILAAVFNLLGRKSISQKLLGSLQVDITKTRELLGWHPIMSVDEALAKLAKK